MIEINNKNIKKEQFESVIDRIVEYVTEFIEEMPCEEEFQKGQYLAYYTIIDTLKNRLELEEIELNVNLEELANKILDKMGIKH